jgi:hypothetical protein
LDREPSGSLFRSSEFDDASRWISAIALSPFGGPTLRSGFSRIVARARELTQSPNQNRARPATRPAISMKKACALYQRAPLLTPTQPLILLSGL